MSEYHTPVLLNESITALIGPADGVYADATFGGGGHSAGILARLSPNGRLIAFDRDPDARANCPAELAGDPRLTLVQDNFRFIQNYVEWFLRLREQEEGALCGEAREQKEAVAGKGSAATVGATGAHGSDSKAQEDRPRGIDGIMADLGVSSHQFDTPDRGFSFRFDAPLDMRMDSSRQKLTAADIVNTYSEQDLAGLLELYGEVAAGGRMADLIVRARTAGTISTTAQLNAAIAPALPKYAEHKTLSKVYQALRIEVNGEMRNLEKFLSGAAASLLPGGRLVVITYHSLEDRMVKNFIRTGNVSGEVRRDLYGNTDAPLRAVGRKPVTPQESEIASNTRSRSAKMRVAERVANVN